MLLGGPDQVDAVATGEIGVAGVHAPKRMGAYLRRDVSSYEGDYLVVRPYYSDPARLRCYAIHVHWEEEVPCLQFKEKEGKGDHKNAGALYIPRRSQNLSFVSINAGHVRQMLVTEHPTRREMFGVISTLWERLATHYQPVSVPVLIKRYDDLNLDLVGDLSPNRPDQAEIIRIFQSYLSQSIQ